MAQDRDPPITPPGSPGAVDHGVGEAPALRDRAPDRSALVDALALDHDARTLQGTTIEAWRAAAIDLVGTWNDGVCGALADALDSPPAEALPPAELRARVLAFLVGLSDRSARRMRAEMAPRIAVIRAAAPEQLGRAWAQMIADAGPERMARFYAAALPAYRVLYPREGLPPLPEPEEPTS